MFFMQKIAGDVDAVDKLLSCQGGGEISWRESDSCGVQWDQWMSWGWKDGML